MISMIYEITPQQAPSERAWLKEEQVFPSERFHWSNKAGTLMSQFGVIVSPEIAVLIKLRHPLQFQGKYRQR